jgi:hypothetical protein
MDFRSVHNVMHLHDYHVCAQAVACHSVSLVVSLLHTLMQDGILQLSFALVHHALHATPVMSACV